VKLPNGNKAVIPKAKVLDYLLSPSHEYGRHKAAFFTRIGFEAQSWERLASALMRQAAEQNVTKIEDTLFGTRYTVEGGLVAPSGESIALRTVWFVDKGESTPRLITAYPMERKEE